jgi:hypothetical protein
MTTIFVLDRTTIPQKKLDLVDRHSAARTECIQQFLSIPENREFDFSSLWDRVMKGNEAFFKEKGLTDELKSLITYEERVFLA